MDDSKDPQAPAADPSSGRDAAHAPTMVVLRPQPPLPGQPAPEPAQAAQAAQAVWRRRPATFMPGAAEAQASVVVGPAGSSPKPADGFSPQPLRDPTWPAAVRIPTPPPTHGAAGWPIEGSLTPAPAPGASPVAAAPIPAAAPRKATAADASHPPLTETNPPTLTSIGQPFDAGGGEAPVHQVGRYRVEARLGHGGMATVYRAHDPTIHRDVAIKFLHASLAEDAGCRARFLREARAAGSLTHPNIVIVHDVGEIQGRPYMTMELVEGATLGEELERRGRLPLREVLHIGRQLGAALGYAHSRGIVHRDIKPGNIMLLRDGSVKVADFGIAQIGDAEPREPGTPPPESQRELPADPAVTVEGALVGTPQYMSPEQARGSAIDGRSDLFAAGIVLYQMVTGRRPFVGDTVGAVTTRILNETHTPITLVRAEAPPALRRVIDRLLAKDPDERYATGEALAAALAKVEEDLLIAQRRRERPAIIPLRVQWAAGMAAIVGLVMALTATVVTQRQLATIQNQAMDFGISTAQLLAYQHAERAVLGEWDAVDVGLHEMARGGQFDRLAFLDDKGIVRASDGSVPVGQPAPTLQANEALGKLGTGRVLRYETAGAPMLGYEVPSTYNGKQVGRMFIGVPEAPLLRVARLTVASMIALVLTTIAAAALAGWVLAGRFAKPLRLLGDSMHEIGQGNWGYRIAEHRRDELGLAFAEFDAMAQSLQRRLQRQGASTPAPGSAGEGMQARTTGRTRGPAEAQVKGSAGPADGV